MHVAGHRTEESLRGFFDIRPDAFLSSLQLCRQRHIAVVLACDCGTSERYRPSFQLVSLDAQHV